MSAFPLTLPLVIPNPDCCEGHFPDNPVVPAVALLDAVLCALEPVAGVRLTVAAAKFLAPVRPGQALLLEHAAAPGGAWRFTVTHSNAAGANGATLVASGLLRPAQDPPDGRADVLQERP